MTKKNNTTNKIYKNILFFLFIFDIILIVLTCVIPFISKPKQKVVESALLNPKYASSIQEIKIELPNANPLVLTKYDDIWLGSITTADNSQNTGTWPASVQTVNNVIEDATKVLTMYKKSDNSKSWKSLSIDETSAKRITFSNSDGEIVSELYFGSENNITNRICVRSGKSLTVYEIDNGITSFLTNEESFWCDPYLYPQVIIKESNTNALRHGKLIPMELSKGELCTVKNNDFGNGTEINLAIYRGSQINDETEYYVFPTIISSAAYTESEKLAIKRISYAYSISAWTYEKLMQQ